MDGTLIDHDGALPVPTHELRARIELVRRQWEGPFVVGLASSRTLRELLVLQRALGVYGPCIAEDGARFAVESMATVDDVTAEAPAHERAGRRVMRTQALGAHASELRARVHDIPALVRADTRGLSQAAMRDLGFRSTAAIRRAVTARTHSVLLDPQSWSAAELSYARDISAARGLHLKRGGRWFTLTTAQGKGVALRALRHQFTTNGVSPVVAAIGNEENDESLLAEADCRFVIRNPHRGAHPVLSSLPHAVVLGPEGPGGWMDMLEQLAAHARTVVERRAQGAAK